MENEVDGPERHHRPRPPLIGHQPSSECYDSGSLQHRGSESGGGGGVGKIGKLFRKGMSWWGGYEKESKVEILMGCGCS